MIEADGHGGEPADWQERLPREFPPHIAARRERIERQLANLPGSAMRHAPPVRCTLTETAGVCPIIFGGHDVSADPFGGRTFPCMAGGGDIFGCELPAPAVSRTTIDGFEPRQTSTEDAEDMETAAVARAAAQRRVPFLAVRAGSDGGGDPLGDRGFPTQFFDYYRLAAHNAGDVTCAVVAELGRLARDRSARRTCRLLAAHRWRSAAKRIAARPNG